MARPRVFISSTYFDLRVVRADLERFIKEIGYVRDQNPPKKGFIDWDQKKEKKGIRVNASIFDANGKLRIITPEQWDDKNITTYNIQPPTPPSPSDDAPF